MLTTRAAWFPLRSNIGYFETTGPALDLESRVKQMAMLCDQLYFEPGMLDVTISDAGATEFWTPPSQLDEEDIRQRRQAAEVGAPVGLWIGVQPAQGVPAPPEAMRQIMGGKLARSFVAEYHLLARDSGLQDMSWAEFVFPTDEAEAEAAATARTLDSRGFIEKRAMPALSENQWLDDRLRKGLNKDIARAAAMGLPAILDHLHQPILEWRASQGTPGMQLEPVPGATALHLWAPNFTTLTWKQIIALHDHDAIGDFRQKLVEAEQTVSGLPEDERELALKDIGYQAALDALRSRSAQWRDLGAELVVGSIVDLVPYGGLIYSALTGGAEVQKQKSEWTTILLELNERPK